MEGRKRGRRKRERRWWLKVNERERRETARGPQPEEAGHSYRPEVYPGCGINE